MIDLTSHTIRCLRSASVSGLPRAGSESKLAGPAPLVPTYQRCHTSSDFDHGEFSRISTSNLHLLFFAVTLSPIFDQHNVTQSDTGTALGARDSGSHSLRHRSTPPDHRGDLPLIRGLLDWSGGWRLADGVGRIPSSSKRYLPGQPGHPGDIYFPSLLP